MLLRVRPGTGEEKRQAIIEEWYREQLKEAVPPLIARWEPLMGVKVQRFFVQRMKTKWGSCNPKTRHHPPQHRARQEAARVPRVHRRPRDGPPAGADPQRPLHRADGSERLPCRKKSTRTISSTASSPLIRTCPATTATCCRKQRISSHTRYGYPAGFHSSILDLGAFFRKHGALHSRPPASVQVTGEFAEHRRSVRRRGLPGIRFPRRLRCLGSQTAGHSRIL